MDPHPTQAAVMIVEDDPMVLATLKVTLETEGYDVTTCSSPVHALTLLPERDYAVIVSDHKMPEMMGLDFLAECRRIRPQASRILLTAVLNLAMAVDAINRGEISRYLSKPWLRVELIGAVRDAVQRHELAARNFALQAETVRLNEQLTAANRALEARIQALERGQGDAANVVLASS